MGSHVRLIRDAYLMLNPFTVRVCVCFSLSFCVCVCVCERERERDPLSVCVCLCMPVCLCMHACWPFTNQRKIQIKPLRLLVMLHQPRRYSSEVTAMPCSDLPHVASTVTVAQ